MVRHELSAIDAKRHSGVEVAHACR
jgi:hypothetical protein